MPMPALIDEASSRVLRFILDTPVELSREEWVYIFCVLVISGFVALNSRR